MPHAYAQCFRLASKYNDTMLPFHLMHPSYEHFGTFHCHGHSGHKIPSGIMSAKFKVSYVLVDGIGSAAASRGFPIDIQSTFVEFTNLEIGLHVHFDVWVCCGGSVFLVEGHILLDLANLLWGWFKSLWLNLCSLFNLFLGLL